MRRAAVLLLFGLTLAVAVAITRPSPLAVLDLPAPGEVRADWLDDGTPVFAARQPDGGVRVLGAEHPFSAGAAAVAWCPPAERFIGVWTGSRFARDGRWMGGPSPHGLERFAATVEGSRVTVRQSLGTPPREPAPRDGMLGRHDEDCWSPRMPGDVDLDATVVHGEPFADAVSAEALRLRRATGQFTLRGAMLEQPDGSVRLCSALRPGKMPECTDQGLVVPSSGHGNGNWFGTIGYQRVQVRNGVARRVVLLAVTGPEIFHHTEEPADEA